MHDYDELKMAVTVSNLESKYRIELVDILDSLKATDETLPGVGDVIMIDGDGSTFLVLYENTTDYILFRYLSRSFFIFKKSELSVMYEKTVSHLDPSSILKERI